VVRGRIPSRRKPCAKEDATSLVGVAEPAVRSLERRKAWALPRHDEVVGKPRYGGPCSGAYLVLGRTLTMRNMCDGRNSLWVLLAVIGMTVAGMGGRSTLALEPLTMI
jgi:hypothetical protein